MAGKPPPERQCTAESKRRPGERCEAWAMRGKAVCYHHGAKSKEGPESATWENGGRSKSPMAAVFTGEAFEHYQRAAEDPRYIELRRNIAILDTLLVQELKHAKVGEGGALWEEIGKAWRAFQEAQPSKDATTAGRALRRMGEIISEGVGRHAAQGQALNIMERQRRLQDSERRRIVDEQQTMSQAQAIALVGAVVASVRKHVTDRETLAAISADIAGLVHQDAAGSRRGASAPV